VDTTVGSTCSLNTTVNTLAPGGIVAGKRSIWGYDSAALADPSGKAVELLGYQTPGISRLVCRA
jgi:hypothetical protein